MAGLFQILITLIDVYQLILILRALTSWFRIDPYSNPFVQILYTITEPLLAPLRGIIPPIAMMDLSPMILFLLLMVLRQILLSIAVGF